MRFVTYAAAEGLGNRLRLHLIAHAYAMRCGAPLIVDWPVVKACGATYSDLWQPHNGIIDASRSSLARAGLRLLRKNKIRYNERQSDLIDNVSFLPAPVAGLVEFGEAFEPYGYENDGKFLGEYRIPVLQALQPVHEVAAAIHRSETAAPNPRIAIHIRRGDFHISFPEFLLPLRFYDSLMALINIKMPGVRFFLSHDDDDFVRPLLEKYYASSTFRQARMARQDAYAVFGYHNYCNRDTVTGAREALADLLFLSRSTVILGAPNSSFSALAAFIGSKPLVIPSNGGEDEVRRCAESILGFMSEGRFVDA